MMAARPFRDERALDEARDRCFERLAEPDWLEAFAAHPRLGNTADVRNDEHRAWSGEEQAGARDPAEAVRTALAEGNERYLRRFGFVFILCATGKSAPEMLAALNRRLENDRVQEVAIAAAEQRAITTLRLRKLLNELA